VPEALHLGLDFLLAEGSPEGVEAVKGEPEAHHLEDGHGKPAP